MPTLTDLPHVPRERLNFPAVLSNHDCDRIDSNQHGLQRHRRMALSMLTCSGQELFSGFRDDPDTLNQMFDHTCDFKEELELMHAIAETAIKRLAVVLAIVNNDHAEGAV